MKCPKADCGFEVEGSFKFCPECGAKMETKPKLEVVICKNTLEDGSVCNAEIKITHKFCNGCGKKVDKQMFEKPVEHCSNCKAEMVPGSFFCSECGERVVQKGSTACPNKINEMNVGPQGDGKDTADLKPEASKDTSEAKPATTVHISETLQSACEEGIETEPAEEAGKDEPAKSTATLEHRTSKGTVEILPTMSKETAEVEPNTDQQGVKTSINNSFDIPVNKTCSNQTVNLPSAEDNIAVTSKKLEDSETRIAQLPNNGSQMRTEVKSLVVESVVIRQVMDRDTEMKSALVLSATSNVQVVLEHAKDSQPLAATEKTFPMDAKADLLKDTAGGYHAPSQPNNTVFCHNDFNTHQEEDTDSDSIDSEGENSSDEFDNLTQHGDRSLTVYSGNEKKRKRKSGKTANKMKREKKRERKREKLEQKKDDVSSSSITSRRIESLTIRQENNKHEGITQEDEIKPHEISEPMLEYQTSNEKRIEGDATKAFSPDASNNGDREQASHDPLQLCGRQTVEVNMKEEKVFGAYSDLNENQATAFEINEPRSYRSLFQLDPKETNNTESDKMGAAGHLPNHKKSSDKKAVEVSSKNTENEQPDGLQTVTKDKQNNQKKGNQKRKNQDMSSDEKAIQECSKNTEIEQSDGRQTRSMTKDKQNNQKKDNLQKKGENKVQEKSDGKKSEGLSRLVNEKTICVHFIALISEDFRLNADVDKVYIRGNLDRERGWNNMNHEMKFTGKQWHGNLEVEYKCKIPYSHLSKGGGLEYKYYIVKNKGLDRKVFWDCYLKHGNTGEGVNRILNIPEKMTSVPELPETALIYESFSEIAKDSDVLQKFDGVVNREPESQGFIGRVKEYFTKSDKLKKDCEQFVDFFCTHYMLFHNPCTVKENVEKNLLLFYQLKKIYLADGRCWSYETEFKREIGNAIVRHMIEYLVNAQQAKDRQTSLIVALTLVSLMKTVPLTDIHFSDGQRGSLCKAFLIETNENNKTCFELEFIDTYYPKQRRIILEGLLQILRYIASAKSKDPSWLFLIPLIHFLNDDCKPFELPVSAKGHQDEKPYWWGTVAFETSVADFKKKEKIWTVPIQDVLGVLQPLFPVDYFLPRTLMAVLNLPEVMEILQTGKVPVDVCCATLNAFMKRSVPDYYFYTTLPTEAEKMVIACIDLLKDSIRSGSTSAEMTEETLIHLQIGYTIAQDMYVNSRKINRCVSESWCMHLFLYCTDLFSMAKKKFQASEDDKVFTEIINRAETSGVVKQMLTETEDWLRQHYCYWYSHTVQCLRIWNTMLLSDSFLRKETIQLWNRALGVALERQLNSHLSNRNPERFIHVYCNSVDSYKDCMQEVLTKVVIKAIEGGYTFDFRGFHDNERTRLGRLLSDMFVNYWDNAMKASRDPPDEAILNLVITWAPFTSFLQVLNKYQEDTKRDILLSSACTEKLVLAVSVIEGLCTALKSGGITVRKLRELQKYKEKMVTIVDSIKYAEYTGKLVSDLIKLRCKEVIDIENKAALVTTLTSACHFLPGVNLSKQDAILTKVAHIGQHCVKDFCKPLDVGSLDNIENCHPSVTAFCLSNEVDQILEPLHTAFKSTTFMKLWQQQSNLRQENCIKLEDVVDNVWNPAYESWFTLSGEIASGDISFTDIERHVGTTYKDQYDDMNSELLMMGINEKIVARRIKQVQQYRQLETSVKGAKVILKFAELYHLSGDFQQIRNIATHDNIQMKMKSFDDSLMDTCKILKDITSKQSHCLGALIEADPLIKWLKDSMKKDGLKELKVFVDLALISAGEQPLDIDRVQGLNTAVLGYSPLIFDLKPDADYKELLAKCKLVWKELDTNPKLPDKLVDSNRHLEWLKTIQKAHGSVEVSSLAQAEAINSSGVFSCGYVRKVQEDSVLVPTKVLKLCVRGQDTNEARSYTYDQLQDLQSRLMLVAGRANKVKSHGKDEVETFTEVFDGMKRLSAVFIKLHDAGCVLFKTWQASFFCDPNRPVCAILEFGQGVDKIKGRRTKEEDTGFIIHRLAKFLEACLNEWLKYISEKRNNYLHLNYFTVDQLVQLQREMVKIGTEEEPSVMIYPLLSAIKQDCTPADLSEALNKAEQQLNQLDMETSDNSCDEEEEQSEDEIKQTFIEEMIKAGFAKNIALKALDVIKPDEIDEGIVWCMQHDSDSDDGMETETLLEGETTNANDDSRTVRLSAKLSHSDTTVLSIASSYLRGLAGDQREFGVGPLIKSLEELWKTFIGSISSNLKDHLSLEHLGLILQNLSQRCTVQIDRPLLAGYKPGVPNLVIVPTGDVINTLLTIYMMADNQPLPQSDEVLLCNSETKLDEVDIFWRRAIFDGGNKIHCLVNADLLDFDVSDRAEKLLEGYIQQTSHEARAYRLVVICGSDNEYRSRIVSALDKYRRPALPVSVCNIANYLLEKFRVTKAQQNLVPAALVDFENCSVRVIKSWRAGVGKTLYQQRREKQLERITSGQDNYSVTVPLQDKKINFDDFIKILLQHTTEPQASVARIFHLDISHEVQDGVDFLLFNLLILKCLTDKTGHVWRRSELDLYLIENMPLMKTTGPRSGNLQYLHSILDILPSMTCHSPRESLEVLSGETIEGYKVEDQLFDLEMFQSPVFQRPFQYLLRLDTGRQLQDVNAHQVEGTEKDCLKVLLRHCGIRDPSWSELHHFVWFLNTQLHDYEGNNFVSVAAAEDLPGFAKFVLRFLIQMSRDFATRSLNMSEESPLLIMEQNPDVQEGEIDENEDLQRFQMRRTWESSPHPYLFFNSDRMTFTFLGFHIDRQTGNLIDQQTGTVLEKGIMAQNLYDALVRNHVPIQENFDALPRGDKITKLCQILGMDMPYDPDDTYELTTDNVKKILAIYMRFRCDIPVIIMGETGCGKTRLVKFMCALQVPPGLDVTNMILMKVHGGTTNTDIVKKVREAEKIARSNRQKFGNHMYTVLFFDEANTTESIGLIKEIMCDNTMEGENLELCKNLKIVAACNPYRKHSDDLIRKLEQAGLGYHVDADKTTDRLGRVPMRRLVYRVQPLPQSMLPLVWDFGQLNTQVEDLYIRQMVRRYIRDRKLPDIPGLIEVISSVLTASQDFMRQQEDECSFVSLRDVDRVLNVTSWFYAQSQDTRTLFNLMDNKLYGDDEEYARDTDDADVIEEDEEQMPAVRKELTDIARSLILALGVCYHACLKDREGYRNRVVQHFLQPCELPGGADRMLNEISCCQDVFLSNLRLEKNIARNLALKENVFMMVVCIELRIPLFLVGKPGSSKSLAKTIVSDAMQGNAAHEELFRELKQVQMVSFQCSPLSTPDGIVGTFRQCAKFQEDKDLTNFVSIVVLDEVGLAEDSPRMPLKTLHPLLEDGCQGDETPEEYKKVAFIGISNWALDPAKMNRGILVQREVPDIQELKDSAEGICATEPTVRQLLKPLIEPMAKSYLKIFEEARKHREFFGLRDFYSLVKMVFSFVEQSMQPPTWFEMLHAIKRNFGGLDNIDPEIRFRKMLAGKINISDQRRDGDPDCSPAALIEACLFDTNRTDSESRYLLLLTENYGALSILQQQIIAKQNEIRPVTIFGSSFPSDQEYTQICRNINKIKVCMETGNTIVLLNLENLYESLYDALNQYYVYFGGERYVDLGLGTHRVKCRVHKEFRLIVVAEKEVVYEKFPIPLINRLEKHFLTVNTLLTREQHKIVGYLKKWTEDFVKQKRNIFEHPRNSRSYDVGDVFMGYHDDTCSAVVLHVWKEFHHGERRSVMNQILRDAKELMLWCATPEAVVRLQKSELPFEEQETIQTCYWVNQKHSSLAEYLRYRIREQGTKGLFAQITTHSKLLSSSDRLDISVATDIEVPNIMLETLQSFDTEQQFTNKIKSHLQKTEIETTLLIVQCDSGNINGPLAACARYCVMDECQKARQAMQFPIHVVFIIQLPRIAGGCFTGFQCGMWHSAHIDDLRPSEEGSPTIQQMQTTSPGTLVQHAIEEPVAMDITETVPNVAHTRMEQPNLMFTNTFEDRPPLEGESMDWENALERTLAWPMHGVMGPTPHMDDLEDAVVNVKSSERPMERGPRININAIVLSCVQTALSMVKDKEDDIVRTTKRVALVLELLQQRSEGGSPSFFDGISRLIARLLKEKEKNNYRADRWISEEAVKDDNVQKAGTFRRACLQVLESKIAPILAGIIAYLDTNHNLDILKQTESPWKSQTWLSVLSNPEAIQLTYEYLQFPTRQSELLEVVVMTTGCEGHLFSAQTPFSWLIFRQLEEIIQTPQPDVAEGETTETETISERVLKESTLGRILARVDAYDTRHDIIQSYLMDYVHFVYHARCEEEQASVCQALEYVVVQAKASSEEDDSILRSLIYVHMAYQKLAPRLKYFRAMNAVWPQCSSMIMDLKQKDPKNEMFSEEKFTFSVLCLLIEDLTPNKDELNAPERRSDWLNKVHKYRPVIEKVMRLHVEDPNIFGVHSQLSVGKAKCLWSRICAVKLFLEHVCCKAAEEKADKITVKHCMPLYLMLGDDVDFKELRSLNVVEKFLKQCNKTAVQTFLKTKETCCQCEKDIDEEAPVILPCRHIVCEHCLIDLLESAENNCPNCNKKISQDYDRTKTVGNMSASIARVKDYQKRCNSFFMDLVSQLCFSDNTTPGDDVIDKLLGYITCTIQSRKTSAGPKLRLTKELTIFESGIDPNPVFRSFLLQLLMKTSGETVERNLQKYLRQAEMLLGAGNVDLQEHYIELCLMVIQCLENIFNQETEKNSEVIAAINRLHRARTFIDEDQLNIDKLYALAFARFGLAVTAKYVYKAASKDVTNLTQHERELIEAAQNLCTDTDSKWPKIYLVKYLCRCFGVDAYQAVCRSHAPCLRWLKMDNLNRDQVVEGPDRYVVCRSAYTTIREVLTKVVLGEDIKTLQGKLEELKTAKGHTEVMFTLAVHREIAFSNLYPANKRRVAENVKNHIQEYCEKRTGKLKDLTLALLQNRLGTYCRQLSVVEGEDLRQQGIQSILVHFLSVVNHLEGDRTLMQPLIGLLKTPQQYARSFIPTMPQDDLADIKEALLAGRGRDCNENPVLYRCPNGHPYVIGNCGRPYVVARCKCGSDIGGQSHVPAAGNTIDTGPATLGKCKCGADIGGTGYRLVIGNILDPGEDRTETGHILGRADIRGQGHPQERFLSPVHCTCLRLLTHMAMFLAAANDPQAVVAVIKPDVEAQQIPDFLWGHVNADLNTLQRVLGCSIDDVFILVHSIINNIMITHNQGDQIGDEQSRLMTKKGREQWEDRFSKTHLVPILQNMETTLKEGTRLLSQDQRLGADPLLCLLYEIDTPQEQIPTNELQSIPAVWRYRTHITMDHLRREFDSKSSTDKKGRSKHGVLKLFLQEEHFLRALKYIPSILKLHRALFHRYQRKLDKAEASSITVETIQREEVAGEETSQLVADFGEAWNLIRNSLEMYVCPTDLGGVTVPKELCRRPITDKTPISVLLPTMKEAGLCSFALLDFLLRKQNDFLDRYMKVTNRNPGSFSAVNPMDVTAAHLISYDPQQDILPVVLANCQYSFEIGKGTKIEYDFNGLERQLMDRFFFSKSRINIERVMEIECMIYRTEFTNAAVFKKLQEKIIQEPMTAAVKHQISAEMRSLPDLCQSLGNLDISISFLKSVGGSPDQNLNDFMSDTLKMENPLHSQKARQDCKFKHTQSLWMLLSFLRTKKMAEHRQGRQSMFESVPAEFYEDVPVDLRGQLDIYFREMSVEKLGVFLEVLHEYVILCVSVKQSQNDEDYEDTKDRKLKDWLEGYLGEQEPPTMDIRVLTNFPVDILYKHAVDLWVKGYEMLCEKLGGR